MFKRVTSLTILSVTLCLSGAIAVHSAPRPRTPTPAEVILRIVTPKLVFTTFGEFEGNLVAAANALPGGSRITNGLIAGDFLCQAAADGAGLSGVFMAWLSDDDETPTTRWATLSLGPYYKLNGGVVAADYGDLTDGSLIGPIDITEQGGPVPGVAGVWTGTESDGSDAGSTDLCVDWTTTGGGAVSRTGFSFSATADWTAVSAAPCGAAFHLYCFEQ